MKITLAVLGGKEPARPRQGLWAETTDNEAQ